MKNLAFFSIFSAVLCTGAENRKKCLNEKFGENDLGRRNLLSADITFTKKYFHYNSDLFYRKFGNFVGICINLEAATYAPRYNFEFLQYEASCDVRTS